MHRGQRRPSDHLNCMSVAGASFPQAFARGVRTPSGRPALAAEFWSRHARALRGAVSMHGTPRALIAFCSSHNGCSSERRPNEFSTRLKACPPFRAVSRIRARACDQSGCFFFRLDLCPTSANARPKNAGKAAELQASRSEHGYATKRATDVHTALGSAPPRYARRHRRAR